MIKELKNVREEHRSTTEHERFLTDPLGDREFAVDLVDARDRPVSSMFFRSRREYESRTRTSLADDEPQIIGFDDTLTPIWRFHGRYFVVDDALDEVDQITMIRAED